MLSTTAVLTLNAALLAAVASDEQYLQQGQGQVTTTALEQGRFELELPRSHRDGAIAGAGAALRRRHLLDPNHA